MKKLLGIVVLGLLLSSNANAGYKEGIFFIEFAKHVKGTTIYKGSSTKLEFSQDAALKMCKNRDPYAKNDPDGCVLVDRNTTVEPIKRISKENLKLKCISDDRSYIRTIRIWKTIWSDGTISIGGYDNGFSGDVIETGSSYNLSVPHTTDSGGEFFFKYIIDKDVPLATMWLEFGNGNIGEMRTLECLVIENSFKDKGIETGTTSGTAFFINNKGNLITNNHVVEGCKLPKINYFNKEYDTNLISTDKTLDLALLKVDLEPKDFISFSNKEPSKRQLVIIAGYPLGKYLSDDLKINEGKISSLKGFENNSNEITVDLAINPGNSGGPIVDEKGQLVAVAVAGMSKEVTEGISFGIKSSAVTSFLKTNKISPNTNLISFSMNDEKVNQLLEESTVYIFCE